MKGAALRTRDKGYKELEVRKDNLSNALTSVQTDSLVLVTQKLTSTPQPFINNTFQITKTMETSQKSTQKNSQTLNSSWEDFLVRHFLLQEEEWVLTIPEGHSSLTLLEYSKQSNLD